MSIFEVMMLVCFGAAWPFNLYNSLRSRTAVGKSLFFLLVVNIGYLSGILHKVLYNNDAVLYLYVVNFMMVSADIAIYCRNRQLDRMRADIKLLMPPSDQGLATTIYGASQLKAQPLRVKITHR